MRREVLVLMGAAVLVTLMVIGLSGDVAAQTVMPGETGVDLTDARGQSGMNGTSEMAKKVYSPVPSLVIGWKETELDLAATVRAKDLSQWVLLSVSLEGTDQVWSCSEIPDERGRANLSLVIVDAVPGTYHACASTMWWDYDPRVDLSGVWRVATAESSYTLD